MAEPGTDPAALTALRLHYQSLLTEAETPARARWLAALEAQEKQRAAEGDFDGAAVIRERRLALLSGKAVAGPMRRIVALTALTARTSTAVDFLDLKKEVGRFRRPGALMEWELPGQIPGSYQVNLVCGVMGATDLSQLPDPHKDLSVSLPVRLAGAVNDGSAGGVVEFRRITSLKEGGALLRASVRSTGGWAMERSLSLGQIELDSKIARFSLKAVDALPAGLMDFRRIELVPVTALLPAAADTAELKELTRLQEVYQKQYSEQTRGIASKYLKGLGELEGASARIRDNDTLALVRQEKQRLGQSDAAGTAPLGRAGVRVLPVTEKLYMLVKGEARLTSQGDYLTRLRPANGCEVTWKLAGLGVTSGNYNVEVECRLTPEHGGTAALAATTPGGNPGPVLQFKVEAPDFGDQTVVTKRKPDGTPGTSRSHTFLAGLVTIPKGSEYLTLRVASLVVAEGGLFDLKAIRLIPAATESP